MHKFVLVSFLLCAAASTPIATNDDSTKVTFVFAVDISAAISTATFSCLKTAGYQTAFVRVYTKKGSPDPNGATNLHNANTASLYTEVYIEPQPSSGKSGAQQLDEALSFVSSGGIFVKSAWLQVTSPIDWSNNNVQANINLIQSFIDQARVRNIGFGIYTSPYDWQQITGGWTGVAGFVNLWYWHVTGYGKNGTTPANFNDFVSFGAWNTPVVKQYGQQIHNSLCNGIIINTDTYVLSLKAKKTLMEKHELNAEKNEMPVAGNLMSLLQTE
uniref:Lysozyme n=1 Tax=Plectus sambesii TaxID=2011161 RepID=A0A914VU31_9BILA